MTFLIYYLIDGVLTLPGIAALVLGVGMAVDANVITCERIKEELRKGKDLKEAYKKGVKNSFSSIFDSNITTFIIAIILFIFGESSVKGFATMLIINIIMTMLIVVLITRLITYAFIKTKFFDNKFKMFIKLYSFINIMKIMGKGKPCFCLTATGLHIYFRYTSKRSFFRSGLISRILRR